MALLKTIRRCQASLASLSAGMQSLAPQSGGGAIDPELLSREQRTLSRFLRNLQVLWQNSQPHPEPRQKRRYTPRLRILFAEHQPLIEQWLEEGAANAAEILRRLIQLAPEKYHEGQLRSMERRVREWRTAHAEQLLDGMRAVGKGAPTGERPIPVATPIGGNS